MKRVAMNVGEQVVDWLYSTQLQVDDEWSIRTPTGFTWWAAENAQTIEIVGEETAPDGETGYLVSCARRCCTASSSPTRASPR
jgi:hypothetical protein